MKKLFSAALAATLVGGLTAAALGIGAADRTSSGAAYGSAGDDTSRAVARRAAATWTGKLKDSGPDTSVKVKFKTRGGEPRELKALRYKGLPAQCDVTGENTLSSNPTFSNVFVNNRRKFRIVAQSDDGDASIKFNGKFSRSFKKVKGKLQETITFGPDNPPAETCVGDRKPYVAKR
jgi:hypothetical protein